MDFERFELSKWLFTTLLGNYQSRLSPTDSAEEALISITLGRSTGICSSKPSGGSIKGDPSRCLNMISLSPPDPPDSKYVHHGRLFWLMDFGFCANRKFGAISSTVFSSNARQSFAWSVGSDGTSVSVRDRRPRCLHSSENVRSPCTSAM